jgi:peptide/nickel transport system substrate-binding protein
MYGLLSLVCQYLFFIFEEIDMCTTYFKSAFICFYLRLLLYWVFLIVNLFPIFSIQAAEPKRGGTIIHGRGGDSIGLDPAHETDGESLNVARNIFDTLVRYKEESTEIEPALAISWDISSDGLVYTFKLRQGVKFHDGTPFNAEAVVFSFDRQLHPDKYPELKDTGAYKYWLGMSMNDIVQSIEAVEEYTVKFTLKRKEAPFLANLGMHFASIVSPTAVKKFTVDFTRNPIGTGPFKFVEWIKDDRVVLEANPDYWDGRSYLDKVIFRTIPDNTTRLFELKSGSIDVMVFPNPEDIKLIEADPAFKVLRQPGMNVGYLAMHTEKKPFDNLKVRQALNHAINKKAIVDTIYEGLGTVAKNPLPPILWGYNDQIQDYEYNPNKTKALLKEAGYPAGFETTLWAMPVPRPYNPNGQKVAEAIQADLQKVGIRAKIVSYEWGTYLEKLEQGEHDMALFGWFGDNGDPDNFLYILLDKDSAKVPAQNVAFYKNDQVHELLIKAKETFDQKEREKLYQQAQVIIHEEAPWVPLAHSVVVTITKARVHNYKIHPVGDWLYHRVWVE